MNLFSGTEGLTWWQGIIEDVNDPEALGRVRVRIFGFHTDDKAKIPTDKLPWASPLMPITSAAIGGVGQSPTGALAGAWVMGFFRDGDTAQDPIIWGTIYGKPNKDSTGAGDYPRQDGEFVDGGSSLGQSDVNPLATGVGPDTGPSGSKSSNDHHQQTEPGPDQSGTANDSDNQKRLSKITSKNGKSTYVASIYAKNFQNFINEFERTPAPNHPDGYTIKSLGGYVHRQSRGSKKWSYHASGVAIDINPAENPYQQEFESDMPANTSAIAKKYGLGWGGDWSSVKDAMHFSMASGERGSVKIKRNGIVPDPETGSQDSATPAASNPSSKAAVDGTPLEYAPSKASGASGYESPSQPQLNTGVKPTLEVSEWVENTDYAEGALCRAPKLSADQIGSQPPYTYRTGIISAAAAMQCSALDFGTVMSYEMGGRWDARRKGPTTQWGQHRGVIQFGEPQAKKYGVDFSTEQTAIDTQLGPNGAVVKYLRAHGVKNGMGRLEIYSSINAGGVGEKYYGRSDANNNGAKGSVRDKVNNQMDGHEANARRLLNSKDDGQYVEQKVYRAVQSGKSNTVGIGPASSKLTDGTVRWEVAPEEFQDSSRNAQNAANESNADVTSDGYSTAPAQAGGASSGPPKPKSVQKKISDLDVTDLFQEPDNPYAAEYPHNKALFTESGHIQEFDDTPGAERIHTMHRSGSFEEYHPDGSKVIKVVKDSYEIIFGENNIHVKGSVNIVVDADVNVKIGGNIKVDVGGTVDTTSGGNTTIKGAQIHLNP